MKSLRCFSVIILFVLSLSTVFGKETQKQIELPDFAYPQDALKTAELLLKSKAGDERILGAMEYIRANRLIDYSSQPESMKYIEQLAAKETDPAVKSLLLILAAKTGSDFKFNESLCKAFAPKALTFDEARDSLKSAIDSLVNLALEIAPETLLKDFYNALDWTEIGLSILPTVRDFVAYEAASKLMSEKKSLKAVKHDSPAYYAIKSNSLSPFLRPDTVEKLLGNRAADYAVYEYIRQNRKIDREYDKSFKRFYQILKDAKEKCKGSWVEETIDSTLSFYNQPYFTLDLKEFGPRERELNLKLYNLSEFKFTLYRYLTVENAYRALIKKEYSEGEMAYEKVFKGDPTPLGAFYNDTLRLQPGHYVISFEDDIKTDNRIHGEVFSIWPFKEIQLDPNSNQRSMIQLLDNVTGSPMSRVTVYTGNNPHWEKTDIRLDRNGCFILPWQPHGYGIKYIDNNSGVEIISQGFFSTTGHGSEPKKEISYSISPDLPVYRPGDKVRLTLVATKENEAVKGNKVNVKITLPNVGGQNNRSNDNRRTLDVSFEETDDFGRATAEVTLPDDCPLGDARLTNKKNSRFIGYFKIAEYKLNDLKISQLTYRYTEDSIFVKGSTTNTAGVPVGNIVISGKVSYSVYVDNFEAPDTEIDTVSNERGVFEFSFPRYWSANTKKYKAESDDDDEDDEDDEDFYEDVRYEAEIEIEAESPNGRNMNLYESVNMEYPNKISFYTNNLINKKKGININVRLAGSNPPEEYIWKIETRKGGKTLASGTAKGVLSLNPSVLKPIEPGKYKLLVELPDGSAQPYFSIVSIYDVSSTFVPTDDPFLLPETTLTNKDNQLEIGIKENDTYVWIYYGYFKKDSKNPVQKIESHKLQKGWHKLPVDVGFWPEEYESGSIKVYSLDNNDINSQSLTVTPVKVPKLKLSCESFRDNVDAGSRQKWQLVTRLDDKPVSAAVYLNIVNSKILALGPISTPRVSHTYKNYNYWIHNIGHDFRNLRLRGLLSPLVLNPEVILPKWRYLATSLNGIRIRGVGSMNSSYSDADVLKESVMREAPEEEGLLDSSSLDQYVVVGYGVSKKANATGSVSVEKGGQLFGARAPEGNIEDLLAHGFGDKFIRDPKVLTALWAPMLTTDADGTVDVSFLVPGESTEWSVSARAWTRDLYSAFLSQKFTATRRLIVAPNPPRFVRVGDRVNLVTAVTNNTDSTVTVTTSVVVTADSVSLVDNNSSITIEPHATNYLTAPVSVDVTGGNLEYTVRISDGVTGDGERNLIPVLPSSALVTESRNFYINPGQEEYSVTLPIAERSDFSTVLHYTTNPMWTVVESLPKAIEPWCEAASAIAMSVYSSRTALELSEKFADAKEVINLTDAKKYAEDGLKKLRKMQTREGGFKWGEWAKEADRYSTLVVLDWLASEADDPEVSKLVKPALDFVDLTSVGKDGKVYPDFNYTVIRSFYGRPNDQNGSRVVNMTINDIMKDWKTYSIDRKALAAIALKNYGYDKLARTILGSLRQFGRQTPDRGFEFPNMPNILAYTHTLEAFASVEPKDDAVNGIVQHLLYIRQGMDWGSSSLTTYAVRSIMEAASLWVVKPSPIAVKVDGQPIKTHSEGVAGALNAPVEGRELTITRPEAEYPAYGAVVSTFIAPLTDIKPFSDGEVKITKTFVRVDKDGKETPLGTDAKVNPGEKLTVVLLVTSKRPLSNIVVTDMRPAAFEPVIQVPQMIRNVRSTSFYLENRDAVTNIYVGYIPAGTSQFTYEVTVNNTGTFTTGRATVASAIAPDLTAHSGSAPLTLTNK